MAVGSRLVSVPGLRPEHFPGVGRTGVYLCTGRSGSCSGVVLKRLSRHIVIRKVIKNLNACDFLMIKPNKIYNFTYSA